MTNQRRLKPWLGWLLFGGALVIVFLLGLLAASVTERRAEIQSIYANKKVEIPNGEARNEIYGINYPRQFETWQTPLTPHSLASTIVVISSMS
ncbi:nitrite reductase [Porphyromonas sp. CAG:1061]|nr:nitrite reductase [Porphyromonas sp. CAG:1061]